MGATRSLRRGRVPRCWFSAAPHWGSSACRRRRKPGPDIQDLLRFARRLLLGRLPTGARSHAGLHRRRGEATRLTLVNFGCGGATTTSLVSSVGCPDVLPAHGRRCALPDDDPGGGGPLVPHRAPGHIGLITVSIGGNDVTPCARQADPITCVPPPWPALRRTSRLAAALRTAAGPSVPLIGLTYPDVILGTYVYPTHPAARRPSRWPSSLWWPSSP